MNVMDLWPLAAFMVVQTVAIAWWAATMTARVAQLEKDAAKHSDLGERIASIETNVEAIKVMLQAQAGSKRRA